MESQSKHRCRRWSLYWCWRRNVNRLRWWRINRGRGRSFDWRRGRYVYWAWRRTINRSRRWSIHRCRWWTFHWRRWRSINWRWRWPFNRIRRRYVNGIHSLYEQHSALASIHRRVGKKRHASIRRNYQASFALTRHGRTLRSSGLPSAAAELKRYAHHAPSTAGSAKQTMGRPIAEKDETAPRSVNGQE